MRARHEVFHPGNLTVRSAKIDTGIRIEKSPFAIYPDGRKNHSNSTLFVPEHMHSRINAGIGKQRREDIGNLVPRPITTDDDVEDVVVDDWIVIGKMTLDTFVSPLENL